MTPYWINFIIGFLTMPTIVFGTLGLAVLKFRLTALSFEGFHAGMFMFVGIFVCSLVVLSMFQNH